MTTLSEDEVLIHQTVQKFAKEVIGPKVRTMDDSATMDPQLIQQCFEQGFMGIEVAPELGGSGMKFMSAILTIEALATVDPSVSVMVDVQVGPFFMSLHFVFFLLFSFAFSYLAFFSFSFKEEKHKKRNRTFKTEM